MVGINCASSFRILRFLCFLGGCGALGAPRAANPTISAGINAATVTTSGRAKRPEMLLILISLSVRYDSTPRHSHLITPSLQGAASSAPTKMRGAASSAPTLHTPHALSPSRMKRPRPIHPLIGMRAEHIALGLNQIGRQSLATITVVVGERG